MKQQERVAKQGKH